jgi:hypothetical protein
MAAIDFGNGANTATGDTVAQAFTKLQARLDAIGSGSGPSFSVAPSISPSTGTAGSTTFTGSPGTIANGSFASSRWLLAGAQGAIAIATGASVQPYLGGSLTYEVTASGSGGQAIGTSDTRTVSSPSTKAVKLLFVGDSIGTSGFMNSMKFSDQMTINNVSVSGTTIATQLARVQNGEFNSFYDPTKTCVAVIQVGTNTVATGPTGSAAYAQTTQMITLLKQIGFYVMVVTILPRTDAYFLGNSSYEAQRQSYNSLVRANSGGADLVFDFAADTFMGDSANVNSNTSIYADGLHPTGQGITRETLVYNDPIASLAVKPPRVGVSAVWLDTASISQAENAGTYTYVVRRNYAGPALSVSATFDKGTTDAADYSTGSIPSGLTANFAAGALTANITIGVAADSNVEPDETFSLTIVAPSGHLLLNPSTAYGSVLNDDSSTGVSIASLSQSGVTYAAGKFGQAQASGVSTVPTTVADASPNKTIEFWFKTGGGTQTEVVCGSDGAFYLGIYNGQAYLNVYGNGTYQAYAGPNVNDGAWHHYAAVFAASSTTFYIDGVARGTINYGLNSGTAPIGIGGFANGNFKWGGLVDDFTVWSGLRYTANFTPPTAPYSGGATNMLALYHLDGTPDGVK